MRPSNTTEHNEPDRKPVQKRLLDPMISSPDSNEYFNAISHLIGAILSVSALSVLVTFASIQHKWLHVIGFAIYGTSLLLSFIASTLLHFFVLFGRYKRVFGILDHCAIYILIAGTYTPFCLAVVRGAAGWWLFGAVWSLAVLFITLKAIFFERIPVAFSNASFILMGWLVVFVAAPIYQALGLLPIALAGIAGLLYTIGAISFARGSPNPYPPYFGNHEIWHLAVLFANALFFYVMLAFVLPYPA